MVDSEDTEGRFWILFSNLSGSVADYMGKTIGMIPIWFNNEHAGIMQKRFKIVIRYSGEQEQDNVLCQIQSKTGLLFGGKLDGLRGKCVEQNKGNIYDKFMMKAWRLQRESFNSELVHNSERVHLESGEVISWVQEAKVMPWNFRALLAISYLQ